ncbi:MAG: response regulator, partial [Bacteroidetes bacterium]|nr:response regulator [Bacteroidota bacterium]
LDKAKTRFFFIFTHEFRTPLTLIIGPLEQLMEEQENLPAYQRLLGIFKNARQLLSLINQMLDLSKLEGGRMRIEVSRGDIVRYTREITSRFQPLADKKAQILRITSLQDSWETHFDKKKWNKIVYNLVSNAIKFTPENGTIELQLHCVNREGSQLIQLLVKDSGIGIDKEVLPHIFDRFYQVDSSSTRIQGGTGIGLSLVKELVELQGGSISVISKVGQGTTFKVEIPVLDEAIYRESGDLVEENISTFGLDHPIHIPDKRNGDTEEVYSTNAKNGTQEKLRLLLIEDNDEMRAYIRQCIDESKYQILEACNGQEGIEQALTHVPDLIISDVMMPKKNGFEVVQIIRSHLITSHIPVILLTARASLDSRLEGLKRGADAYLTKPFSPQELTLRIHKIIEIRQILQARYASSESLTDIDANSFEQEDAFVKELKTLILEHLNAPDFNGEKIVKHFGVSRTGLYNKVKALTGQGVSEYIRLIRLERAYQFIQEDNLSLS